VGLHPIESLSVVVPAYNAAPYIGGTLDSIRDYLGRIGIAHETIVVDDGSGDATAAIVERRGGGERLIRLETNRGKGYAVRQGMLAARYAWSLFTDADNATTIDHLERFAPLCGEHDVLMASRRLRESKVLRRQPRLRQTLGRVFPYLVKMLVLPQFEDTQCGFKLFRREAARDLFGRATIDRFAFDVEVLAIAVGRGWRVAEVAVDWRNPESGSTLSIGRDPWSMLRDVVRVAIRSRRGTYRVSGGG